MFKQIEHILKEMDQVAETKVYFHAVRSVIGNLDEEAIAHTCFMYEFENEKIHVQISAINEEYPMQSMTFTKFIPEEEKNKNKELKSFIDKYVKKLEQYEHHCLVNVYDLTDFNSKLHTPITPIHFWMAAQLSKVFDKRIVGNGREYIKRKIKLLKEYK